MEALIPEHFGIAGFQFQVQQPDDEYVGSSEGRPLLAAEFHLVSSNTAKFHPLADPNARWQFRWVVRGEAGMDYVEEFTAFRNYQDGRFDYLVSSRFPRDSKWVAFRLEQRMTLAGPWRAMANFRIKNPSHPETKPWSADATPVVKRVKGMEFILGDVTLETKPLGDTDPFDHVLTLPFRVQTNALTLTNWSAALIQAQDASGNWYWGTDYSGTRISVTNHWTLYQSWRPLDPRFVWRFEVDFSPTSQFTPENLHRFRVPVFLPTPLLTNFAGVPLCITWANWNPGWLFVSINTNRADVRLLCVSARDSEGQNLDSPASMSPGQGGFVRELKVRGTNQFVDVTVAIVPNVHVTYYVRPKLVSGSGRDQSPPGQPR
jgi:hypothetical protein